MPSSELTSSAMRSDPLVATSEGASASVGALFFAIISRYDERRFPPATPAFASAFSEKEAYLPLVSDIVQPKGKGNMWKFALVAMLCMGAFASSTSAQESSQPNSMEQTTSNGIPGRNAYRIGPLDVLDISVFQAPDLSKTVEVAEDGTIDLPLLGATPQPGKRRTSCSES